MMSNKQFTKVLFSPPLFSALTLGVLSVNLVPTSFAAPGELSDQPLSLVTSTKPNMLLLLDDSGSMEFQNIITTEAQDAHPGENINGFRANHSSIEVDRQLWRLCAGYNALAFNPNIKYEKWKDYIGNTFVESQSLNSVKENPLDGVGDLKVDLSDDIYIRWDDDNDDGRYSFSGSDGECGPGVAAYDAAIAGSIALPQVGTITSNERVGVFTDSNYYSGRYHSRDRGILVIDIPFGGDASSGDTITFDISAFHVDRLRGDTDSLTVYGGLDIASPVVDAITVTELFDGDGNAKTPPNPYDTPTSEPLNVTSSVLELNDSSLTNLNNEIKQFIVKGSQVTLVFNGGENGFTRSGFVISWAHSSAVAGTSNGVVTEEDCTGGFLHCVRVDELPETEADALANPLTADQPYNTQENYANWYTYYRKRDYVAKKALGDLVYASDYRVGFTSINDNGDGGVIIKDMGNNSDGSITSDKSDLLQKIYRARTAIRKSKTKTNSGTPLIRGLINAGLYFTEDETPETDFFGSTVAEVDIPVTFPESITTGDAVATTLTETPIFNNSNGGQCQQNFTLVFSDGAWTDNVANYADDSKFPVLNINGAEGGFIGDIDSINSGDNDNSGDGDGDLSGGIYADGLSDTMADVAMYYFLNDLAPSATDSLSLNLHGDTISHQHMVTFSIGFGVNGTVDRNPNVGASPADTGLWPDSVRSYKKRIDDFRHAGFNSRGDYLSARNVQELQTSLDDIITEIGIRLDNTAAGASFSAFEISSGEFRYDTLYSNVIWWGELEAFEFLTAEESGELQDGFSDENAWSADAKMFQRGENRHIASNANGRKIITYNGSKGIPFAFPSSYQNALAGTEIDALSVDQVNDLLANAPHLTELGAPDSSDSGFVDRNQVYGEVLVDYLRGSGVYDNKSLDGQTVNGVDFDSSTDGSTLHLFRNRAEHYLGAFIHSEPRFVGAPSTRYPDSIEPSSPYSEFANNDVHSARRSMIYVGGNDGMLHGFFAENQSELNTDGGEEVFAYIPKLVSDTSQNGRGLSQLALEGFDGAPYVDGSPIVADVFVNREDIDGDNVVDLYEQSQWRSYLVGGLRAGGKGIYVLDVTNPDSDSDAITHPKLSDAENVANQIVVNEFTHPDMGHIFGQPRIGKMNNGRWAAIVGNGYNSSDTGAGKAALFIVYLDKATEAVGDNDTDGDGIYNDGFGDYSIITASETSWIQCAEEGQQCTLPETAQVRYGADNTKNNINDGIFTTPQTLTGTFTCDNATFGDPLVGVGKVCEYSDSNGLSQPRPIDVDRDGLIDRIYAGDLHGNMWVFDVSASGRDIGDQEHTTGAVSWGLHVNNTPFFTACSQSLNTYGSCPRDNRQPITSTPLITNNPRIVNGAKEPNHLVFFGTGQYITDADKNDISQQSFYGIWDAGKITSGLNRKNLTERSVNPTDATGNRTIVNANVNYSASGPYGWYYTALPEQKERVVLNPLLFGNTLLFQTLIPIQGICNTTAGSGFIMAVDPLTGGNPTVPLFGETNDGTNIAGIKIRSVIVGSSLTRTEDDTKLNVKTADGRVTTTSVSAGTNDISSTTSGDLYHTEGRKAWSILR